MDEELIIKNINLEQKEKSFLKSFIRELKINWGLFLILMPGFLFVLLFSYIPMFGIIIAFKEINYVDGILGSPWVGFKNFEFLFKSADAFVITRNTVLYNLTFIVLGLVCSVTVALGLNEVRSKVARKVYQNSLFLPYFLSWVVVSYLVSSFLNYNYGFINKSILGLVGIEPINWYAEARFWPVILPIVNLWKGIGYGSVLYLAGIAGIDTTYYEAALIDGATKWQQIFRITIPLLKPIIVITTILSIGRIFNADFGLFYQVTLDSGQLYPTTSVIDTYVYRALTGSGEIGMASAAGLFQSIVGFFMVLFTNLAVRKFDGDYALF